MHLDMEVIAVTAAMDATTSIHPMEATASIHPMEATSIRPMEATTNINPMATNHTMVVTTTPQAATCHQVNASPTRASSRMNGALPPSTPMSCPTIPMMQRIVRNA